MANFFRYLGAAAPALNTSARTALDITREMREGPLREAESQQRQALGQQQLDQMKYQLEQKKKEDAAMDAPMDGTIMWQGMSGKWTDEKKNQGMEMLKKHGIVDERGFTTPRKINQARKMMMFTKEASRWYQDAEIEGERMIGTDLMEKVSNAEKSGDPKKVDEARGNYRKWNEAYQARTKGFDQFNKTQTAYYLRDELEKKGLLTKDMDVALMVAYKGGGGIDDVIKMLKEMKSNADTTLTKDEIMALPDTDPRKINWLKTTKELGETGGDNLSYHIEKEQIGKDQAQDYRVFTDKQGNVSKREPIGKPYANSAGVANIRVQAFSSMPTSTPGISYDRINRKWMETDENGKQRSLSSAEVKERNLQYHEQMPTTDIKVMQQSVPSVLQLIGQSRKSVTELQNKLGPLESRWRDFWSGKVGAADPDFRKLKTNISLLQTRLMKMHVGSRGGEYIMKHFTEIIDASKDSPQNLIAAMDEIEQYANEVKQSQFSTEIPGKTGAVAPETKQSTDRVRFQEGNKTYSIPPEMVDEFKRDHPNAQMVK